MPIDDLVLKAMARWPNVPAMHGWLRLTRRGRWMLIDRGMPGFDEALHGGGSEITSPPIIDFIGRNYLHDTSGRWYWQNGPQRVFVDLELAPLLYRVMGEAPTQSLVTHTGYPVQRIERVMDDAAGNLWLITEQGPGCIDDRDLGALDIDFPIDADIDSHSAAVHPQGVLRLLGEHRIKRLDELASSTFGFSMSPR